MEIADQKRQLRDYFDGLGFERWSAIYGDAPLSAVRQTIREGHSRMLATAAAWLDDREAAPASALDAGCGTGLFSLELARRGVAVTAVDLAPQMAEATEARLAAAGLTATCRAGDLETVGGSFGLVVCFDVLIHYPRENFGQLCGHLASLAEERMLLTYAPYSAPLALLHRIGGLFPHSQRRTEIQMIPDRTVVATLAEHGLRVRRVAPIRHRFYHVTLVEAVRGEERAA